MIQRIQTVYLALVCAFSLFCLFKTVGVYMDGAEMVAHFSNFSFLTVEGGVCAAAKCFGPWALGVLLIVVIFLSLMSIMLFRKRMRQLRLTIFSTILLIGYVLVYAAFSYVYLRELNDVAGVELSFRPAVAAVLPVVNIILNYLAIHSIRKDEALVRSLDRIR